MGAGIAVSFTDKFMPDIRELMNRNVQVGGSAEQPYNNRYVFYLVTKELSSENALYSSLEQSLTCLRRLCERFSVKSRSIPKIASGIDHLDWNLVLKLINSGFAKANLSIETNEFSPASQIAHSNVHNNYEQAQNDQYVYNHYEDAQNDQYVHGNYEQEHVQLNSMPTTAMNSINMMRLQQGYAHHKS